jgi:SAM-dependent methyltransferase
MDTLDEGLRTVEESLSNINAGRILDVATGNGGFITFLLDNIKGFTEITGIDLSERPLEAARKNFLQENIQFLQMDATCIDFADDYFDTVSISNSLHHMQDLSAVLSEMKRVCKPDGCFLISEMYRDDQTETQLTHVALHHWWAAVDSAEGILHRETYTRQEIFDIVEKLGLRSLNYFDLKDLSVNPRDPELIQDLDGIIDRYLQRIHALPGHDGLLHSGEQLRQRVHAVGFHGATTLFAMGRK